MDHSLNMEVIYSSEKSVTIYQPTWRNIPEGLNLQTRFNFSTRSNDLPVTLIMHHKPVLRSVVKE
jgi:hypothetical protein